MSRLIHFDLSADDPQRAAEFYRAVFGWQINKWQGPDEYWMIQTGSDSDPGITGGLGKRIMAADSTAVIFDTDAIDAAAEQVIKAGGHIREAKRTIPGVGYLLMCRDTEGNTFGIMQIDEAVK